MKHAASRKPPEVALGTAAKMNIIRASVPADKSSVTLEMLPGCGASGSIVLTPHGLSLLIETLGRVQAALVEHDPSVRDGQAVKAVFDPPWRVAPALQGEATALTFRHPAHGPLGFVVPIAQVKTMVEALSRQVEAAEASKSGRPN